ncbi:hypothetical protein EWM62_07160 [Mucilaginibacter terrigena]|uniref:DUF4149 domain-containing protein n=1 Tax=Mucilaginibacter terrigena TaxID=2492395 RepID=A0A4Q5LQS7_9SPHI|nr:hypothetical protein [Mucilaginibacter terrigena]RYU91709.1 hypothetical protein EWM62_07160 [Mucilaginibacter terrigena]
MDNFQLNITYLIQIAGLAQIVLVFGSLAVPRILNWSAELAKLQPLIKQMFWTYAAYILVINLCFGLVSLLAYKDLLNGSLLATLVTAFIAVYWISRVLIQFFYFDRKGFPTGKWHTFAEVLLVSLFISLSMVYSYAFYHNL